MLQPIRTRRKGVFYVIMVFATLFYLGFMGILMFAIFLDDPFENWGFLFVSAGAIAMWVYSVRNTINNVPVYTFDTEGIRYRRRIYRWSEVASASLAGKVPYKYLWVTQEMEGVTLQFSDGTIRYLYENYYTNLHEAREMIGNYAPAAPQPAAVTPPTPLRSTSIPVMPVGAAIDGVTYYKGRLLTSAAGIGVLVMLIVVPGLCLIYDALLATIMFFLMLPVCLVLAVRLNYIGLSAEYLEMRKHIFYWRKKRYYISGIEQVLFDADRGTMGITIYTGDHKHARYLCPTLQSEEWLALKQQLVSMGISVRDENNLELQVTPAKKKFNRVMNFVYTIYILFLLALCGAMAFVGEGPMEMLLKILFIVVLILSVFGLMRIHFWLWRKYKVGEDAPKELNGEQGN